MPNLDEFRMSKYQTLIKPSVGVEAKKVAMAELLKKGGHGNGEAELRRLKIIFQENPDLIILIPCTELCGESFDALLSIDVH